MNWINTNISNINIYFNKKDYLILGVIVLLATNIGLGLGYFVNTNYLAKTEILRNASASQTSSNQNKSEILNVDLGVTIEEQEILDDIQKQNEILISQKSISSASQTQNLIDKDKFTTIEAPKLIKETQSVSSKDPNNAKNFKSKSTNLSKITPQEINDTNGRKITYNLKQFGINAGYIWDTDIAELGQTHPYTFGISDNQSSYFPTQPKHIEQLIPAQEDCPDYTNTIQGQKNWLSFGKYGVETPIQNGSFGDFYNYGSKGEINLGSEIQEDKNAIANGNYESVPVQKLLKAGVVHLPITPAPGQIGNSYIIGHTSNFPQVKSAYNKIFKPFESKSRVGDEFTIWDHKCRQMTFRVFEAFAIGENDTATAYQNMGNRRVVTLQGSILDANWQPTKRWLTRGELVE